MLHPIPHSLRALLDARTPEDGDTAWSTFLEEHSPLLLRVARAVNRDHDGVMDQYLYVLDALRRDDYHRLRAWSPDGHGRFETWLVVVARRLCYDYHRERYGRQQKDTAEAKARHSERRNLIDLVSDELGLAAITSADDDAPDLELERADLHAALKGALDRLEVPDRLLLRLRFEDSLSVPEIGRLQGEPSPFAIYRRLDRVLGILRRSLQAAGFTGPST